jgi:ABC-type glycerol-3-phosphate transport system permease component
MKRKKFLKNITFSAICVYGLLIVVGLLMVLPFVHEWAKSFSFPTEVAAGRVAFWPKHVTLGNYEYFYRNHLTTLICCVVGRK